MAKLKGSIPAYSGIPKAIKDALGPVAGSKSSGRASSGSRGGGKGGAGLKVVTPKVPKTIPFPKYK